MLRYWLGTADTLWSNTANWSDTSGGSGGFSVPTASDDVIFDGGGNNPCEINASERVCKSYTVDAGYTNTITHTQRLTVSGNITWHSGFSFAGSELLIITGDSTITSGGKAYIANVRFAANSTKTFVGDFIINGVFITTTGTGTSQTLNKTTNERIICNGGISVGNIVGGTLDFIELRGGTWSVNNALVLPFLIEPSYNDVTISGIVTVSNSQFNYVASTYSLITTGSTVIIRGTCAINFPHPLNNISFGGNTTKTLFSDFEGDGLIAFLTGTGNNTTLNSNSNEILICNNGLQNGDGSSGTTLIELRGGTCNGGLVRNALTIYPLVSIVTITGTLIFATGQTLTYTPSIYSVATSGSTLNLQPSCSLDTNVLEWNNITFSGSGTRIYTLLSSLIAGGLITSGGTGGFTINSTSGDLIIKGGYSGSVTVGGTASFVFISGAWSSGIFSNLLIVAGNFSITGSGGTRNVGTTTIDDGLGSYTVTGTLLLNGNLTINSPNTLWSTLSVGAFTITISGDLFIGTLSITAGATFTGTNGWQCVTLSNTSTAATTITLQNLVTYTITNSFSCFSSRVGSAVLFTSNHASNRANLVMVNPSLCNVLASFTRIDASGGRTINSFGGTIIDSPNVRQFYDYQPVGSSN
jgi:hypothetical protein